VNGLYLPLFNFLLSGCKIYIFSTLDSPRYEFGLSKSLRASAMHSQEIIPILALKVGYSSRLAQCWYFLRKD